MNWITIAQLIVTSAYLLYIKVIPSISDSYRTIRDIRIYHAFFFLSAVLIACQGVYSERLEIPYVIAGFFFYALSLASAFWKKSEGWIHSLSTLTAIITGLTLTVVRVWTQYSYWALSLIFIVAIGSMVIKKFSKNSTYWIEVLIYIIVFVPLIKKGV